MNQGGLSCLLVMMTICCTAHQDTATDRISVTSASSISTIKASAASETTAPPIGVIRASAEIIALDVNERLLAAVIHDSLAMKLADSNSLEADETSGE